jgi:microcystin-dependent protein
MDVFLGEIKLVAFNFAPVGFLPCDGRLMPINQNAALFSLLGTTYGGDGIHTFALPKLPHVVNPLPSGLEIIAIQGIFPSRG